MEKIETTEPTSNKWKSPRRWSIFWPLLLIVAGVVLFLNAIGTIKGSPWDIVFQYWPVIFIIGGLDGLFRRETVVFSTLELGVALAYQLSLLGTLTGIDWFITIRFWPLILIALALDLIIGRRSIWANLIALGAGLLLLACFGLAVTRYANMEPLNAQTINQSLEGATQGDISISPSIGRLIVSGGADKTSLINLRLNLMKNQVLDRAYKVDNGTGTFNLSTHGSYTVVYPNLNAADPNTQAWNLRLNSSIPVALNLNLGVGEELINLSETHPTSLDVKMGVGMVTLTLPAGSGYSVKVNNGIGATLVYVPKGTAVRVHVNTGLAVSHLPGDFTRNGDNAYSPGAGTAEKVIDLSLEQDIGSLEVRYLP